MNSFSARHWSNRILTSTAFAIVLSTAGLPAQQPLPLPTAKKAPPVRASPDSEERKTLVRVQILLDLALFRPGKIDGLGGEFTQRCADRLLAIANVPRGTLLDLSKIPEPYKYYTVTAQDLEWIGPSASTPSAQARQSSMPYTSIHEMIAEKFHCELEFLRELNPDVQNPDQGTVFRVPAVPEFSILRVKELEQLRAAEAKAKEESELAAKALQEAQAAEDSGESPPTPSPAPSSETIREPEPRAISDTYMIVINRKERVLDLYQDALLIASFPCTPGSRAIPVPKGEWKITSNILFPYFRYDKSVLRTGVRSANAHNIPPGPNNYVGIVWMGINRRSVGIHGTNTPDAIGRNESSGCIRLANWDAWEICTRVSKNTPVIVQ